MRRTTAARAHAASSPRRRLLAAQAPPRRAGASTTNATAPLAAATGIGLAVPADAQGGSCSHRAASRPAHLLAGSALAVRRDPLRRMAHRPTPATGRPGGHRGSLTTRAHGRCRSAHKIIRVCGCDSVLTNAPILMELSYPALDSSDCTTSAAWGSTLPGRPASAFGPSMGLSYRPCRGPAQGWA